MSKRRVCLIWLLLIIAIICCSTHTSLGQEEDSVNISYPSSLPAKSEVSHEDILNHAQSSLDRSISIHNQVAIVMGLLVALITLIVGIGSVFGYLKIRQLEEYIVQAKESAEETKIYEAEAKKAVKDIRTIVEWMKKEQEEARDRLGEEIEQFPALPEPFSEDQKKILDEYGKKIESLEAFGVPLKSEDYLNRGTEFYQRGKYELALKAYDKAIESKSDFADAKYNRGVVLDKLGRYKDALKAYNEVIESKPDFTDADGWYAKVWFNRGVALDKLGRYEDALNAYEGAIELKFDFAEAWNNKGVALAKLDRYDNAIEAYKEAIASKSNYAMAWYNKACAYSRKGDKENALKNLSEATYLDAKYKEMAKSDEAFINYRADEDFKRIVS